MIRNLMLWGLCALLLSPAGCCSFVRAFCPPVVDPLAPSDEGPYGDRRVGKAEILRILNERAAKVEILRVPSTYLKADVETTQGEELTGLLAVQKPRNTYFEAEKGDRRFGLGSNDEEFWFFETISKEKKAYFGRWKYVGLPCARRLPLDPVQVFSLLGAFEVKEDAVNGPLIGLTYSPNVGHYVLHFQRWRDRRRHELGVWYEKEVHLTRNGLRPFRVVLYSPDGAELMRAELRENYEEGGRMIPTDIRIFRPVYDKNGLAKARDDDRLQFVLADKDAAGNLVFHKSDTESVPRPFGPPENVPAERFRKLFDPETRVRPYVEQEEYIDKDCEREQTGPPAP